MLDLGVRPEMTTSGSLDVEIRAPGNLTVKSISETRMTDSVLKLDPNTWILV